MPYVMAAASVVCSALGIFEGNPHLDSPAMKIYTYIYLVLSLLFSEMTIRRLMTEYREQAVHHERITKVAIEHVGQFHVRLETTIMATP